MAIGTRTLLELSKLPPGPDRIRACGEFITHREEQVRAARKLRNDDVRLLVAEHGPAKTATLTGLTLANVRSIQGRP